MLPGSDYLIACPHCSQKAKKRSLLSANTFGAKIWSDGFMLAMMYPDLPDVVRCKNCRGFYHSCEATVLKEISLYDDSGEYDEIEYIAHLVWEDYPEALDSKVVNNPDIEFCVRRRYWWAMNHFYRRKPKADEIPDWNTETYNKNAERLLGLCQGDNHLLQAELLRNLGEFDVCLNTLKDADNEPKSFANQIIKQARKKNKIVFLFE